MREIVERAFQAYSIPLATVNLFKYLVWVLVAANYNFMAVVGNLCKAKNSGKDSGTRGRQPKGLGEVFKGVGSGGDFIWVGDVGAEPPHGMVPGKLPENGRQADNG